MLKTLIVILILVLLIALGLNSNLFSSPSATIQTTQIKYSKEAIIKEKELAPQKENIIQTFSKQVDNNLTTEIQALFRKAKKFFHNNQDEEAQNTYSLIIKKVQDHNETKILKYFAQAYEQKAFLFKVYPTYDSESAIEMLELIIKKFENAEDFKLIELYINAKLEKAYLQTKEDSLETYDELLKKFKNREEPYFKKKVEDFLLEKSFALMGENDEEAMEILDELINKYQKLGKKNLPKTIKSSILNNIELAIITNNDDSNYRELADTYMSDSPDKEPLLDMLDIIRNSQDLNQDDALKTWQKNHNNYRFPDWSFDELRRWAYRIEDKETKERVSQYIDAFENHKYSIESANNSVSYNEKGEILTNETSTDDNSEQTTYTNQVEDVDPYANDTSTIDNDLIEDAYLNDIPMVEEEFYENKKGIPIH